MLDAVKFKGMTGIWSALKTGNHIVAGSQYIDYLPLAFIAPLEAKQYINLIHIKKQKACERLRGAILRF